MGLRMKLESLPEGPLVRLFAFTPDEAGRLHECLVALSTGEADRVAVHELPYVEAVGGSRLTLRVNPWDQAMVRGASAVEFECGFTRGTWDNVAFLIEPFAGEASGYQWLARGPGEADLLISVDGDW
jgi:hypothetical protein